MRVKFDIFLLYNGKITGQLKFDKPYTSLFGFVKELREFTLSGAITSSGRKLKLVAERCVLGSYKNSVLDPQSRPESSFGATNVLFSDGSMDMDTKPSGEFMFEFGLVNVYENL